MSAWVVGSSIVSPLGMTTSSNYENIRRYRSGIREVRDSELCDHPFFASKICGFPSRHPLTRFESLCHQAVTEALHQVNGSAERTLYILSTTKGNIALLNSHPAAETLSLAEIAKRLALQAGIKNSLVISNACISGVLAILAGKRFLESGKYDQVVVVGADELSKFVVTGFESLQAMSAAPCKPFDADRNGINLGEAAAVLVLRATPGPSPLARISGGGVSNDANHISGPSRTGNELALAIGQALEESGRTAAEIDFISAHGTATVFNDEMEAKAFTQLGFGETPVHSLKGYFGHTLGAAGVVESAVCIEALRQNEIPATLGFSKPGVSRGLNVSAKLIEKESSICLKTASGFGGCNAAVVMEKN